MVIKLNILKHHILMIIINIALQCKILFFMKLPFFVYNNIKFNIYVEPAC